MKSTVLTFDFHSLFFFLFPCLCLAEIRRLENRASSLSLHYMESKLDISHFRCQDRLSFYMPLGDGVFVLVKSQKHVSSLVFVIPYFS